MPAYANNYLNITSTDAIVTLQCEAVIPVAVQLQNFSTDQSVTVDEVTIAEGRMGVDGGFAAGYIPVEKSLTITLEANSPSTQYLTSIMEAAMANCTTYNVTITVDLPSVGMRYIYTNGTMISGVVMSNAKKLLEPTTWKFKFAKMDREQI